MQPRCRIVARARRPRRPLRELFEDTLDALTPELVEQHAELERHVRAYPADYDLQVGARGESVIN
jgi:hypothetical protein